MWLEGMVEGEEAGGGKNSQSSRLLTSELPLLTSELPVRHLENIL